MAGAESIPDAEVNSIIHTYEVIDRDSYPETTTHLRNAARMGNVSDVANLLRRGADPNIKGIFCGATALHDAVRVFKPGTLEIARMLLEHGAALDPVDTFCNSTALDFAVQGMHLEVVKLLLEKGAKATFRKFYLSHTGIFPQADALVRMLLEHGAPVNEAGTWGRTPLMFAAQSAPLETVERLLKAGADPTIVGAFNKIPVTALGLAEKAKRKDVVAVLKKAGATK